MIQEMINDSETAIEVFLWKDLRTIDIYFLLYLKFSIDNLSFLNLTGLAQVFI